MALNATKTCVSRNLLPKIFWIVNTVFRLEFRESPRGGGVATLSTAPTSEPLVLIDMLTQLRLLHEEHLLDLLPGHQGLDHLERCWNKQTIKKYSQTYISIAPTVQKHWHFIDDHGVEGPRDVVLQDLGAHLLKVHVKILQSGVLAVHEQGKPFSCLKMRLKLEQG